MSKETAHIDNVEFLVAILFCETFLEFCEGQMTTLELDSVTAKAWMDSARYTHHSFDRCAKGKHLVMLKQAMKIRTARVPSKGNVLADKMLKETPLA